MLAILYICFLFGLISWIKGTRSFKNHGSALKYLVSYMTNIPPAVTIRLILWQLHPNAHPMHLPTGDQPRQLQPSINCNPESEITAFFSTVNDGIHRT